MVGTAFSEYVLTIYSFELITKMKTSHFCVLVISALVVQISEANEVDKMVVSLFHSLVDIVEIPYRKFENIINPSEAGEKKEPFLDDLINKFKRMKDKIETAYIESLSLETGDLKIKRLSEYTNTLQRILNALRDSSKMAKSMIYAYFNQQPKSVQNKLIGLGEDLNNILHKLKEISKNDSPAG